MQKVFPKARNKVNFQCSASAQGLKKLSDLVRVTYIVFAYQSKPFLCREDNAKSKNKCISLAMF